MAFADGHMMNLTDMRVNDIVYSPGIPSHYTHQWTCPYCKLVHRTLICSGEPEPLRHCNCEKPKNRNDANKVPGLFERYLKWIKS